MHLPLPGSATNMQKIRRVRKKIEHPSTRIFVDRGCCLQRILHVEDPAFCRFKRYVEFHMPRDQRRVSFAL